MSLVREITQEEFNDMVLNAKKPVIVNFYADWSSQSIIQDVSLKDIARQYSNDILILKVNVDRFPELARSYWIHNAPTLLLFKNGSHSVIHSDIEEGVDSELMDTHEFSYLNIHSVH